jgi:hypothetical protein
MKTTKNIWNSFLQNWMREPVSNVASVIKIRKEQKPDFTNIRATDINVHFGEG